MGIVYPSDHDCPHLRLGLFCGVAEKLSGLPNVAVRGVHCEVCKKSKPAMAPNNMTAVLARKRAEQLGKLNEVWPILDPLIPKKSKTIHGTEYLKGSADTKKPLGRGPGTELHRIVHQVGFRITATCKCLQHIQEMNARGCDWCSENIELIVSWLEEESRRRGYGWGKVRQAGAQRIVKRAIKTARRKEKKANAST